MTFRCNRCNRPRGPEVHPCQWCRCPEYRIEDAWSEPAPAVVSKIEAVKPRKPLAGQLELFAEEA